MSLEDYFKCFRKGNWVNQLSEEIKGLGSLSKNQVNKLVEHTINALSKNRFGVASNYIYLGLFLNDSEFLDKIKRKGILRHTNYLESRNPISILAINILDNLDRFQLNEQIQNYFESLINFEVIYKRLKVVNSRINNALFKLDRNSKINKNTGIKYSPVASLLALNEYNFLLDHKPKQDQNLSKYDYYNREQISESISYLVSKWEDIIGLTKFDLPLIDLDYFKSQSIKEIVADSCALRYFKEIEISIESGILACIKRDTNVYIVPYDIPMCQGLSLAYIMEEKQMLADYIKLMDGFENPFSYNDLAKSLIDQFPNFIETLSNPIKSYRLKIPEVVIQEFCTINLDAAILEERLLIQEIEKHLLVPFEEFGDFKLKDNLNLIQFLSLYKVFLLINSISTRQFVSKLETEYDTVINSICPVIKEDR